VRGVTVEERRARLGRRHHLAADSSAADVTQLAESLVGLHASDPSTVFLSARARVPRLSVADVDAALYDDGLLVKHLCMRRTLFVLPPTLLPVVQAACTGAVLAGERRRLIQDVERSGLADDGALWLADAELAALAAVAALGSATGAQLSRAEPVLRAKVTIAPGKAWGGEIGVAGRVLGILAASGRIRRGRPSGSWTSSQHRWGLTPDGQVDAIGESEATAELTRRWLRAFGPAPVSDLAWWTGLGTRKIGAALATIGAVGVDLDGEVGVLLPDDQEPEPPPHPWAALLPSLDPTTMGWKRREWYLGEHGPLLFDRNGNAGPTVWWDGRIVGGWAQRTTGEVAFRLLEDVGSDAEAAIEAEASRLQEWVSDTIVTTRFPTPLERELRA
jgi:hypothetical protein